MRPLVRALTRSTLGLALTVRPLAAQVGQSFTVPTTPTPVLQQLTVGSSGLSGSGSDVLDPFFVRIYALSGTTLAGPSLFSQNLGPGFSGLTLTPNLALTPGGVYAVVVFPPPPIIGGATMAASTTGDFYPGGQAITCSSLGSTCGAAFAAGSDLIGFAVTFAPTATTTPEPGTWALVATGLLALAGVSRRRARPARSGASLARSLARSGCTYRQPGEN